MCLIQRTVLNAIACKGQSRDSAGAESLKTCSPVDQCQCLSVRFLNRQSCHRQLVQWHPASPVPATRGDSDLPSASVNCFPVMDRSSRSCMTRVALIVASAAHRRSVL